MQHAQPLPADSFPWRTATLVAVSIALVELVALIVSGAVLVARSTPAHHPAAAKTTAASHTKTAVSDTRTGPVKRVHVVAHPLRARSQVRVLVLNGNGRQGVAHVEAAHLQAAGYPIAGAENAVRHDYARSMVMFVPGWSKEARRLAREIGIRLVAPVDGLTPARLRGARVVVLLGS